MINIVFAFFVSENIVSAIQSRYQLIETPCIYKIFYSIYAKRDTLLLSRIKPSLRQFEFGASLATKVLLTFCV